MAVGHDQREGGESATGTMVQLYDHDLPVLCVTGGL